MVPPSRHIAPTRQQRHRPANATLARYGRRRVIVSLLHFNGSQTEFRESNLGLRGSIGIKSNSDMLLLFKLIQIVHYIVLYTILFGPYTV